MSCLTYANVVWQFLIWRKTFLKFQLLLILDASSTINNMVLFDSGLVHATRKKNNNCKPFMLMNFILIRRIQRSTDMWIRMRGTNSTSSCNSYIQTSSALFWLSFSRLSCPHPITNWSKFPLTLP